MFTRLRRRTNDSPGDAEIERYRGQERIWIDVASRLGSEASGKRPSVEESSFFMRSRTIGPFTVNETSGMTRKGASMMVIATGDSRRLFCAYVNAAGAGAQAAVLAARVTGIIRGALASSMLVPDDLRRIALVANDDMALRDMFGRFVAMGAWIVDRQRNTMYAVDCGDVGLCLEHSDGSVAALHFPDVTPLGIIESDAVEEGFPQVVTVPLGNVTGCFTIDDGLIDAVSTAWSLDNADDDVRAFLSTVHDHAYARRRLDLPEEITGFAGDAVCYDACDRDVPLFVLLQATAAGFSLRPVDEPTESYSTIDIRLAKVMRSLFPNILFQEINDDLAVLDGLSLDPSFAPAAVRATWPASAGRAGRPGRRRRISEPLPVGRQFGRSRTRKKTLRGTTNRVGSGSRFDLENE